MEAGIVGRQAAARYLDKLAAIGVLQPLRAGREKLFIHTSLLGLLEASAHEFDSYE